MIYFSSGPPEKKMGIKASNTAEVIIMYDVVMVMMMTMMMLD